MARFDDLSPYSYTDTSGESLELLCIGWLDASHDYPTGPTPDGFRAILLTLCAEYQVVQTRGFHHCPLPPCDQRPDWPPLSVNVAGREAFLGSAEIRVAADRGIAFAAPDLIYHYAVEHNYEPPPRFVEAVQQKV